MLLCILTAFDYFQHVLLENSLQSMKKFDIQSIEMLVLTYIEFW